MTDNNIVQALKTGVSAFRVTVPLTGSAWADEHFYLSPESSGTEGKWKSLPYQIGPLNWMTSDDIEEFNWQKSRRVGYTKCLLAAAASSIEQKNRNIVIWQPTDGDAKDFVTDEVDTILRDVPVLGQKLKCAVGTKSKFNTVAKKSFHGATLDIKGGKSARNFRRMTKDIAIYDELSAFDNDIDGEGSATELGDGRLDQAPFPKSIRGSTPKTKGICQIEAAVENSDMLFYRFVKCPHCGELQRLEFSQLKWENDDPETVRYLCKINSCEIYYRQYPAMDKAGRWQTLDGYYYSDADDRFFSPDDELISKPRRIGARIWAGYSYLRPWSYLVDKWITASKNAKNGNITTLKAVINTLLGETFEATGETVNSSALGERVENYLSAGAIPVDVLVITVGADVQGGTDPRIELEFVGHGIEAETWSLDYVVIPGDVERTEVWDHLDDELKRRFARADGVEIGVSCTFIDSGYLANEVYKYTGPRRRRNIYSTKGVNTGQLCNKGSWQGDKKKKSRAILRTVNVDDAKTIIFNRLRIEEPGPGFCHFPEHYTDRHFEMLTNEEKLEKRKRGVLIGYEWVKKGPNEPLDCRAYALGAFEFLNPNLGRIKLRLERFAATLKNNQIPEKENQSFSQQQIKTRKKKIRGQSRKGGFINGWR